MKGKMDVVFGPDFIQITKDGKEVAYWQEDEWVENSEVVFSICNAIVLALSEPAELMHRLTRG